MLVFVVGAVAVYVGVSGSPPSEHTQPPVPRDDPAVDPLIAIVGDPARSAKGREFVWTIAREGGPGAFDRIRSTVLHEYPAETFTQGQDDILLAAVRSIGLLAADDADASQFSLDGCSMEFWERNRGWESPRGAHINRMLVSCSIQAVGIAGTAESADRLRELREKRSASYLHKYSGDIVQAAYYLSVRESEGDAGLEAVLFEPFDYGVRFKEWISRPPGSGWHEWADATSRGPIPPEDGG